MDLRRARIQDWLVGVLGALLIASLFLPWYRACATEGCESGPASSGWESLAVVDGFLLVAGLIGVVALGLTLAHRTPAVPLGLTSLGTIVSLIASVLVVIRLIAVPDVPGADADVTRLLGVWLGTGATLGLLAAMLASIRDERTPAPAWSRAEQAAAIRTLSLSSAGGGEGTAGADPTGARGRT